MIRQVNLDMDEYRGKSTDTKPSGVANGVTFLEIDTGAKYMYDEENGEWCLMPSSGGGGGGGGDNTEVISARTGADGTRYGSLKGRLDAENEDLNDKIDGEISLVKSQINTNASNISNLSSHKVNIPLDDSNQPTNGTNGQTLRTKGNGATEWADVGLPTDEQTAQAVSDWLDDHPEATTTVDFAVVTKVFPNITRMLEDLTLEEGDTVRTVGYYTVNDGGGALYRIYSTAPATHYETLANGLYAELLPGDYVTAEMFGAHGDDTADDTAALNTAVQWAVTYGIPLMLLPKTYLVTGTINVLGQARIRGFNNTLSKIRYTGSGVCLDVTSWAEISGLYLLCDNSVDTETVGINVDNAEVGDSGTRTHIRIENCRIGKFRKSGINLDNHWQVVIDNCYFDGFGQNSGRNNVGIRFDYSGDVLSGWSGSGDLITNCYFRLCDYGIYNRGGWDLTVMNSIFEYNGYGIYKQEQGNATTLIGCWFENNSTAGVCGKAFAVINCRNKDQLDMSSDSRYIAIFGTSENEINSTLGIGRGGKMRVWGFAAPAKSPSVPVEAVSLECFGRYYANSTFGYHLPAEDDDYMVGRLILQAIGNGANSGQAVGILSFLSGRKAEKADASFAPIEVFRVNNHGSILPMNRANDLPTIGSADYRYGHAYLDAVSIKGDDGNYYQIKVNSSGTLYTTRL